MTTTTSGVAGARSTSHTVGATMPNPSATSSGTATRREHKAAIAATAYPPTAHRAQAASLPPVKSIANAYPVNATKQATSHLRLRPNWRDGSAAGEF